MLALLYSLVLSVPPATPAPHQSSPQTNALNGVNLCDASLHESALEAVQAMGISTIRLTPDRWGSTDGTFLMGSTDRYKKLNATDLRTLRATLDAAHRLGLRVIISMRSLPGLRWSDDPTTPPDARLWTQKTFQDQTVTFWSDLAAEVGTHPAVAAFDPLHAPKPLLATRGLTDPTSDTFAQAVATTRSTLVDSDALYDRIIRAIRISAPKLPVIVHSIAGGSPHAMRYLRPQADPSTIYAFRAFEPLAYTAGHTKNGRYSYPERMPGKAKEVIAWSQQRLRQEYDAVLQFQRTHDVRSDRILVSEYGAPRTAGGVVGYFAHLIKIFRTEKWHRLLYCFQSTSTPQYDYELGTLRDLR